MNTELQNLIATLRAEGFAYPCTMCKKMWRARDRGENNCEAERDGKFCAGPPSGHFFPLYEGPLTRDHMAKHCFACGADALVVIEGRTGRMGICKRHTPLVERVVPSEDLSRAGRAAEERSKEFDPESYRKVIR